MIKMKKKTTLFETQYLSDSKASLYIEPILLDILVLHLVRLL